MRDSTFRLARPREVTRFTRVNGAASVSLADIGVWLDRGQGKRALGGIADLAATASTGEQPWPDPDQFGRMLLRLIAEVGTEAAAAAALSIENSCEVARSRAATEILRHPSFREAFTIVAVSTPAREAFAMALAASRLEPEPDREAFLQRRLLDTVRDLHDATAQRELDVFAWDLAEEDGAVGPALADALRAAIEPRIPATIDEVRGWLEEAQCERALRGSRELVAAAALRARPWPAGDALGRLLLRLIAVVGTERAEPTVRSIVSILERARHPEATSTAHHPFVREAVAILAVTRSSREAFAMALASSRLAPEDGRRDFLRRRLSDATEEFQRAGAIADVEAFASELEVAPNGDGVPLAASLRAAMSPGTDSAPPSSSFTEEPDAPPDARRDALFLLCTLLLLTTIVGFLHR